MDLTYNSPTQSLYDATRPGESWFFYWRSSASLWKDKISEIPASGPLLVPLYWGFHAMNSSEYDFGESKPETDLLKLFNHCQELGRKVYFLLPLSPLPLFPNGGLPHYFARTMSQSSDGLAYNIMDNEGRVNHLYSFFDPLVLQNYRRFLKSLANYLTTSGSPIEVLGVRGFYLEGSMPKSYLTDSSSLFSSTFAKYLQRNPLIQEDSKQSPEELRRREKVKAFEFTSEMQELYSELATEALSANWLGKIDIGFIAGSPTCLFKRAHEGKHLEGEFLRESKFFLQNGILPCSALLPGKCKDDHLSKYISSLMSYQFIEKILGTTNYDDDFSKVFEPYSQFNLIPQINEQVFGQSSWEKSGLEGFLQQNYRWTIRKYPSLSRDLYDEAESGKIFFIDSSQVSEGNFSLILRIFMSGNKVILDNSLLSSAHKRSLEIFIAENDLKRERVKTFAEVDFVSLGEGGLVLFDNKKIQELTATKQYDFWNQILRTLEIETVHVDSEEGADYQWLSRSPHLTELNFQEVRRLSLRNPTSYKKKIRLSHDNRFALMKVLDEDRGKMKHSHGKIMVELMPGGSLNIDFGFLEE